MAFIEDARVNLHSGTPSSSYGNGRRSREDKPQPTVWANIGFTVETHDPQTGEIIETFVSLPFGVGIDTMDLAQVPASNGQPSREQFRQLMLAKNQLLKDLQDAASKMEPGSNKLIPLQVQLNKVRPPSNQVPTAADGTNPFVIKLDL